MLLHAKYAIVDGRVSWIGSRTSEMRASLPIGKATAAVGDRGRSESGGHSPKRLRSGLRSATTRFDSAHEAVMQPLPSPPPLVPWSSPPASAPRAARIVLAPDTSLDVGGILGLFDSAQARLSIDAFYLDEMWRATQIHSSKPRSEPRVVGSPCESSSMGAGPRRGRLGDERRCARADHRRATNESLPSKSDCSSRAGPSNVSTQGRRGGRPRGLVSSMNWALGSATENREVGLIVDDRILASTFESSFDADWEGRPTSGVDAWRLEDRSRSSRVRARRRRVRRLPAEIESEEQRHKAPARVRTRASFELISAADIEKFGYCPLSWWLSRGLAPEEGPELAEGEKKHEAASADLKGIEAHEAKAREAETGVLYFAIAASIVAIVG